MLLPVLEDVRSRPGLGVGAQGAPGRVQTVRLSLGHVPLLESVAGCFLVSGLSGLLSLNQNGVLVKLYWVLSQEANKGLPWRSGETVDPRVTEVILGDLGLQ